MSTVPKVALAPSVTTSLQVIPDGFFVLRSSEFPEHHVGVFRNMRFEAGQHVVNNHGLRLSGKSGRSRSGRRLWGQLLLHLIQKAVQRPHYRRPEGSAVRRSQVERVDLSFQNGHDLLHPAIRVEQAVARVADFGEFRPERAPRGKNVDRLPDGIAHGVRSSNNPVASLRVAHENAPLSKFSGFTPAVRYRMMQTGPATRLEIPTPVPL